MQLSMMLSAKTFPSPVYLSDMCQFGLECGDENRLNGINFFHSAMTNASSGTLHALTLTAQPL